MNSPAGAIPGRSSCAGTFIETMRHKAKLAVVLIGFAIGTTLLTSWQVLMRASRIGDPRNPARLWHRMVLTLLGIRVHLAGDLTTQRPLLIVANHVSWTDIMVLGSIAPANFIAKSEVAQWPMLGRLFRWQNSVFVERDARHKAHHQTWDVAEKLKTGDPLVLFAEGTTGSGNRLLPFKSTLFGAAAQLSDTAFAVQPVALDYARLHGIALGRAQRACLSWIGDQDLVPHLLYLIKSGPIDVEVRFGRPIGFQSLNRKQVAVQTEAAIREMIASMRRAAQV